jgi:hypothetical protein
MNWRCFSPRTPASPPRRSFAITESAAAQLLPESTLDQDEHDNGHDRYERDQGVHQASPPPASRATAACRSRVADRIGGHPEPGVCRAIVGRGNAGRDSTVIGRGFLRRGLLIRLNPAVSHELGRMARRKIALLVQTKRVRVPALHEVLIHVAIIAPENRPWP